jgi:hypothetical protein
VSPPGRAASLFVDQATGDDGNDGLTWATARATVTSALGTATSSPEADVVSVAEGRYHERIVVPANVTLYGGFPSGGGVRGRDLHETILDGDHARFSVVRFPAGSDGTTFDGFVVQRGFSFNGGGGVDVVDAAPLIRNNRLELNHACLGGGISLRYTASRPVARVEDNVIRWNRTDACPDRTEGGGIRVYAPATVDLGTVLVRNSVVENWSLAAGGIHFEATGRIEDCVITGNFPSGVAGYDGVTLTNVLVAGNAPFGGVGVRCTTSCRLENVTAADNEGSNSLTCVGAATVAMSDAVIWASDGEAVLWDCPGQESRVTNSIIEGGFPGGVDILDADPLFVPGPLGDHYLAQPPVQVVTSPAVDTGSTTAALRGLAGRTTSADSALDAGIVDLGYHPEALAALSILRGTTADALTAHRTVSALPFTDDPGTLSDPGLPLLFYRVVEATNEIAVERDETADAVRLAFVGRP